MAQGDFLSRPDLFVNLVVGLVVLQVRPEFRDISIPTDGGIVVIEMKQIPQLKRFIGPGNADTVIFGELKGPVVVVQGKAVAVKDAPDFVERLMRVRGFGFTVDRLLNEAGGIFSGSDRDKFNSVRINGKRSEIET